MAAKRKAPVLTLPDGISDPYSELELALGASDKDIKKAYRGLSRIYHPDKHATKSDDQKAKSEAKFMKVKAAHDFLTDDVQKKLYDDEFAKKAAAVKRKQERDGAMDEKRRAMKKKLDEEENRAKSGSNDLRSFPGSSVRTPGMPPPSQRAQKQSTDKIRKENRARKEAHSQDNLQREENVATVAAEIRSQRNSLGLKSVSIKWKRKVHNFSEEDLISLLKHYGEVDSVNFVGTKGNAALVVFASADDAAAAAAYASNDNLRIDVVGAKSCPWASPATPVRSNTSSSDRSRDTESLAEFNANRTAERERLARQIADEEAGIKPRDDGEWSARDRAKNKETHSNSENFFDQFPIRHISAAELLAKEKRVFEFLGCV